MITRAAISWSPTFLLVKPHHKSWKRLNLLLSVGLLPRKPFSIGSG